MKVIIHKEYEVTGCNDCPYYQYVKDGNAQWLDCHHEEKRGQECPLGIYDPTGKEDSAKAGKDSYEEYKKTILESKDYRNMEVINEKNKIFWNDVRGDYV